MDDRTPRNQEDSEPDSPDEHHRGHAHEHPPHEQLAPVRTVDAPEDRPGVPMKAEPSAAPGAHWTEPARQPGADQAPHRMELERATPVFGTAQPLHGLSGILRTKAYAIPEHFARHWLLLLVADRVDVVEDRLGAAMAAPLERAGMVDGAHRVRGNPIPIVAGLVVGAWAMGRAYRSSRELT